MSSYASGVGICIYAMKCTRCDITHALGVLRKYISKPGNQLQTNVNRVLVYLWGTTYYAILYQGRPRLDRVIDVHGFVDVDWVGDIDCGISTSGYVFNLFGGAISWMSKRHDVVAL